MISPSAKDGALLMERVRPGTHLPAGADAQAIDLVKGALAALHACRPQRGHSFPSLVRFLDRYWDWVLADGEAGTAGLELLGQSRAAAVRLCRSAEETVLLHGDFIDRTCCSERAISSPSIPSRGSVIHVRTSAFRRLTTRARAQSPHELVPFGRAVGYDAERCAR